MTNVMMRNDELFARAPRHIPGGVNSPVRSFRSVGGKPRRVTIRKHEEHTLVYQS